ncbi:hypothetical protein L0337_09985 [candidate division KSB1 bacterium]|nr:hypothetical protein [candidate division KSB1 bacterium]
MNRIDAWMEKANENALKLTSESVEIYVHILIDKEDDLYTAHCLEFDIVADGKTVTEARQEILKAIVNHVSFCIATNNTDNIMNPAPGEYWNKYYFKSKKVDKPYQFPKDYSYDDVKLPFLHNLIPQVTFNKVLEYA